MRFMYDFFKITIFRDAYSISVRSVSSDSWRERDIDFEKKKFSFLRLHIYIRILMVSTIPILLVT